MISQFSFLCLMQHEYDRPISFAHAQLQNSVNKAKNTKRNITQTSKETKLWNFDESFARCHGHIIKY